MSDALIREVQEDLQRDRALALAKRYGGLVAAIVVLVIAGTAAYVGWQNWQAGVRSEESARLYAAMRKLENDQPAAARADFLATAKESSEGIAAIARFQAAQAAVQEDKPAEAAEILDQVATGEVDDAILKDAALIGSIGRRLDSAEPMALIEQIEPLTQGNRPFRHQARELLGLAKLRAGDRAGAVATFDEAIKDPSLPIGARARLTEYRAALETAA